MAPMAHPKIHEMIAAAEHDIRQLRAAKTSKHARQAWISFLEHANRALNRLEGYSKHTGQIQKYKDLLTKEVWANDLTKYMRTARNAHEHGVEDIEISEPFNSRTVFPNGQILGSTIYGTTEDGKTVVMPQAGPTEIISSSPGVRHIELKPGIRMIPIVSPKGETVMPPHVARLEAEDEPEALAAAREYLKWVVEQISTFT